MARTVLNEQYYTFNPSTRVIVIPRVVQREQLLLITNVTTNTVIYNFSDNALRATAYAITGTNFQYGVPAAGTTTPGKPYTTITLNYNTSSMSASDELQFIIDAEEQQFIPAEQYRDPVDKLRVSTPQALIDTDFEYSVQPSKWEAIQYIWNRPSFFSKGTGGNTIEISAITGNGGFPYSTITVTTVAAHGLAIGDVVTVQETTNQLAEGTYVITSIPSGTQFTYLAKGFVNGTIFQTGLTTIYAGDVYDFSNIPSTAYSGNGGSPAVITVTTPEPHGLLPGATILVNNAFTSSLNGNWIINNVSSATTFTYTCGTNGVSGGQSILTTLGTFTSAVSNGAARSVIRASLSANHALKVGDFVQVTGSSNGSLNGNWVITNVIPTTGGVLGTTNTIEFLIAGNLPAGAVASVGTATVNRYPNLYVRAEGYIAHRALDGGVLNTTSQCFAGGQSIRQTRRYFRYQSGKGMQFSTGAKFTPSYDIDTISANSAGSGSKTVTVTTIQDHNLQVGASVTMEGLTVGTGTNPYNGTFLVTSVTSTKIFTYSPTADASFSDLAPGGAESYVTVSAYRGGSTRVGLFDDQNGFFFEFDGITLNAVRRWGVKELFGTAFAVQGSTTITGSGTRFREQLTVGDSIILRGATYRITRISNDTSLAVSPAFRGVTPQSGFRYLKVQEYRVPQSQWNLDKVNGTGPSGYNIDIKNMQMAYIDYTWYGAGFIRFGFRATNGDIVYCHKMPNNNVNKFAYMRSGNLPGRFEVSNIGPYARVMAGAGGTKGNQVNTADTTIYVENITGWPTDNNSTNYFILQDDVNIELCSYTGINTTFNATAGGFALTGVGRRVTATVATILPTGSFGNLSLTGTASAFTFSPDSTLGGVGTGQVVAQYVTNSCAPLVSHWGVSVIMDGRFDDDKGVVFTTPTGNSVAVSRLAISTASASGNTITITTTANPHNLVPGSIVTINGNAGNINRDFQVSSIPASNQFTIIQTQPTPTGLNNAGTVIPFRPLLSLRIAPTADNAIGRNFGIREILNRMQLNLVSMGINTNQTVIVRGILNPSFMVLQPSGGSAVPTPDVWEYQRPGAGSLAQVVYHAAGDAVGGGDTIFSIFAQANNVQVLDLSKVRDLGNSIFSGNGNFRSPSYPNGPDILTIGVQPIAADATVFARVSWTEAQA